MLRLSRFPSIYGSVRCPQLLLNDKKDFYKTWWIVRLHNEDVHVVRNLILGNLCGRYGCLDLSHFSLIYGSMHCLQLLHDMQDFDTFKQNAPCFVNRLCGGYR